MIALGLVLAFSKPIRAQDMNPCENLTDAMITVYSQCLATNTCQECLIIAGDSLTYWKDQCGLSPYDPNVLRAVANFFRLMDGCTSYY